MRATFFAGLVTALALVQVLASEPGHPLDCGDWVLLEPGLVCTDKIPYPCKSQFDPYWGVDADFCGDQNLPSMATDGLGGVYRIARVAAADGAGNPLSCGKDSSSNGWLSELQIRRWSGPVFEIVAYIRDRCVADLDSPLGHRDVLRRPAELGYPDQLMFDRENGSLLLPLVPDCVAPDPQLCSNYSNGAWMASISGFTTTFEILQTYEPASNTLSFRVPYMPEGLSAADHFDTYYGPLANPIDFTQAQPLQCGYPAARPTVGDYINVADPLPTPAPGQGRYYVTAVTYQGQRRYGRQRISGVLSGRHPTQLPACVLTDDLRARGGRR